MGIDDICTVSYTEETGLVILDQTKLPNEEVYVRLETKESVWDAIRKLMVRGAPAIGVCAGYGLAVSMERDDSRDIETFRRHVRETAAYLNSSRPTAVNLSWALERLCSRLDRYLQNPSENAGGSTGAAEGMRNAGAGIFCPDISGAKRVLFDEAEKIRREDEAACRKMGEFGLALLKPGMGILTHCNAGTLATAKYGTCLSPIYVGQERGYDFRVFADETRPLLQGARLTSWELMKAGVDVTLICDNMANQVMKNGWIDAVVVGCDRMAANGDGANKIGTSGVAVLAKEYGIPFYMFVPTSTIDLETKTGEDIVIEQRDGEEIGSMWYQRPMAPAGVKKYNPA
ncbi:MAG: S-methyl-5-thioribose-1-phosphate isomerase, partial [Eubacterium pyruvativorans]|uniref:S-methyl-5-thioribose-1-phosphate isomerase n=1 Tax=Eubacterium pyruvativorans TaxID=155865 RepID=UPI002A812E31